MPPLLIALSGYAGVGKDTVADALVDAFSCTRLAFANKVRETAARLNPLLDVSPEVYGGSDQCNIYMHYNALIDKHGYDVAKREFKSVRKYLVDIGQGLREVLGDSLWIDQVKDRINLAMDDGDNVVVTDCRYENEALEIQRMGGVVVLINRPGVGPANDTERDSIAKIMPDYVIDNDESVEALGKMALHTFEMVKQDKAIRDAFSSIDSGVAHFAR